MSGDQRVTFKHTRPNPLFQLWLQELYDEAKEKGSKLEGMLKTCLESLSKYPLSLKSGADCAILEGFGKKLCLFLDKRLEVYNSLTSEEKEATLSLQNVSQNSDEVSTPKNSSGENDNKNIVSKLNKSNNPKSIKSYKPAYKSGSYALLIALLNQLTEYPDTPSLSKTKLIEKAQPYSEESFTQRKPGTFYTAWSNMTRLILKGLLNCDAKTKKYYLTSEGIQLAQALLSDSQNIPTTNDIIFNNALRETVNISSEKPEETNQELQKGSNEVQSCVEMLSGSFEIILLIDKMETSGLSNKNDPTVAQFKKFPDLKHEYRHLKIGDFTWVARSKVNKSQELVLPFIVERKRMDDLGASIKDGRFHEQKFRLRKCGLKNVIYLVENFGNNRNVGLPFQYLMQALANTRVQDGFKVHITDSLTNSARFLAMMTKRLTIEYKDRILKGAIGESKEYELMSFEYFNKSSIKSKTLTVTEFFIKMLLQLKGMSVEKALAITSRYKSPKHLIQTYNCCSQREGEVLLANLKYGDLNRNVGPTVSKVVYQLFTLKQFP